MKKYFILILLLLSISFAGLLAPENGATLSATHIKFEWEQVPDATEYIIEINGSYIGTSESLIYISTGDLTWNTNYSWIIKPVFSNGSIGGSIGNYNFSISNSRSNASATGSHEEGVTIFSSFFDYYSAAIDKDGNEIWNSGNENLIFYNTDYYGQLFGAKLNNGSENYLPVVEYNLNNEIIWQEPADHFSHHEMIQLPNGNYMSIVEDIQLGPIPPDIPNAIFFILQGYEVDGVANEFPWVGDRLVEWDHNGNEVWSWSTHDYFSREDYDEIAGTWSTALTDNRLDWTHANAFWFAENENVIYFSSRHLSRITKIDYSTGNIIWNMGLDMPSGDVGCGHDIGFSFQHSVKSLENGNIVTLDNGNLSTTLNNTSYPTSRGIEIAIDGSGSSCEASLVWSYDLPEDLFGFASGNVQKLDNGNYLITTVGGGGTTLEISPDHEIVWEANYNLSLPNGAVYRANRLSSLYPVVFSVTIPDMYLNNSNITIDTNISFDMFIYNDGSEDETFCIEELSDCVTITSSDNAIISVPINSNIMNLTITPEHRQDLTKNIAVYINNNCPSGYYDCLGACDGTAITDECGICDGPGIPEGDCDCYGNVEDCAGECGGNTQIDECGECGGSGPNFTCNDGSIICDEQDCPTGGQCEDSFTYFELENIPNSTIVLDGSQCFSNIDLGVLDNIITANSLTLNSIEMGTQNWFNGHLTRLTIGNFYDGGNVTLTTLPESIGDLPNIAILYLNYNELTSLPDSITNLTNLIYLVLSFNNLTDLPENIGNLSNMIWLDLGYNSLESIPESIGSFPLIDYLWIFNNNLSELPESICNLDLNWDGLDYNFLPYFGSGGNMLCQNLPECVENSENINTSIDPLYYSFLITVEQDCGDLCGGQTDVNGDGIINVVDIISIVNTILSSEEISDEQLCSHDVNGDGILNVVDIIVVINIILGIEI